MSSPANWQFNAWATMEILMHPKMDEEETTGGQKGTGLRWMLIGGTAITALLLFGIAFGFMS